MNLKTRLPIFKEYGEKISFKTENVTVNTYGFLMPLRYKNRMYVGGKQLDSGYYDGGHYILMVPVTMPPLKAGNTVNHSKEQYTVKRADKFTFKGNDIYIWAVVVPYGYRERGDYDTDSGQLL